MELFDGPLWVHYGQAYVVSDGLDDMQAAFAGQQNGLLGAAVPGALFLVTGTHTGHVPVRVRSEPVAPPVDDRWEEVVEASVVLADEVVLVEWGGQGSHPLDLPAGSYRARWCARGVQEARDDREREEAPDAYELVLWPAEPAPDAVVRQTSAAAASWHRSARGEPEPVVPLPPATRASREAWAALVGRVRAGEALTGERGRVVAEGVVPQPPRAAFRTASRPYGWFGHGGSAPLHDAPGHEFVCFLGHLTMEGTYVAVDPRARTAVLELAFRWHDRSRAPLSPPASVLRLAVHPDPGGSRVAVVHEGLPVEWQEAFALLWRAQLDRLAHLAVHGWTGPVPVEDVG